jgi:hypothetical protein
MPLTRVLILDARLEALSMLVRHFFVNAILKVRDSNRSAIARGSSW